MVTFTAYADISTVADAMVSDNGITGLVYDDSAALDLYDAAQEILNILGLELPTYSDGYTAYVSAEWAAEDDDFGVCISGTTGVDAEVEFSATSCALNISDAWAYLYSETLVDDSTDDVSTFSSMAGDWAEIGLYGTWECSTATDTTFVVSCQRLLPILDDSAAADYRFDAETTAGQFCSYDDVNLTVCFTPEIWNGASTLAATAAAIAVATMF